MRAQVAAAGTRPPRAGTEGPWRGGRSATRLRLTLPAVLAVAAACSDDSPDLTSPGLGDLLADMSCSIPERELADGGVGLDGIPSLTDPEFVSPDDPDADYLRQEVADIPTPRVVGVLTEQGPLAIPHQILWWHEIVNLDLGSGAQIAVTYCPLTGSTLAFDREPVNGAVLGVSGLLFRNNMIMYDRRHERSLWFQMPREARCGPEDGARLPMVPVVETTWEGWLELHPDTRVVGGDTGMPRDYTLYPYGSYERDEQLQFSLPSIDDRRPMKERVLGIPSEDGRGGVAFPFGALDAATEGPKALVETEDPEGRSAVVLWDEGAQGAMAYRPRANGQPVTLREENGGIVDEETGSEWALDGRAMAGPLEGERLEPVAEAYVAFWFAWADFHPETELWEG